jgi:hypothetical protein
MLMKAGWMGFLGLTGMVGRAVGRYLALEVDGVRGLLTRPGCSAVRWLGCVALTSMFLI